MALCNQVTVAMAFNEQFVPVAAVALASLLAHTGGQSHYDLYILSNDLTARTRQLLEGMNDRPNVAIHFLGCDTEALAGRDLGYTSYTRHAFTRLYLPQLLPQLPRILYLDSDTLIGADVARLFSVDLHGHALGCCLDRSADVPLNAVMPIFRARGFPYDTLAQYLSGHLGLPGEQSLRSYFNSGVLLIDMEKYAARLHATLPQLMQKDYAFADQDILNAVFCEDRLLLPEGWNVCSDGPYAQWYARHGCLPWVLHYAGGTKPCDDPRPGIAEHAEYWRVLAGTPFFFEGLERWIRARLTAMTSQPPASAAAPAPAANRASRRGHR